MKNRRFIISIATIIAAVMAFSFLVRPDGQAVNESLHAAMEAVEAISVLLLALFLVGRKEEQDKLLAPALGFLGMGILNAAHAASWPGDQFVLLRGAASLAGGIGFALAWFPPGRLGLQKPWVLPAVIAISLSLLVVTFLLPNTVPIMMEQARFSSAALVINALAGMLFLTGTSRFMFDLYRSNDPEDLLFSLAGLFFGLSGLTFQYSILWSYSWWFWHALRLIASLLVLGLIIQRHLQAVFTLKSSLLERRLAEERIRQLNDALAQRNNQLEVERSRLQGVIEGIADEVWVSDAQGRMSLLNLRTLTAMGLEAFKDQSLEEVLEVVEIMNPDGSPRKPEQEPLLRSLAGEVVRGEEIMRHRRTGIVRYRQFSSAPIRDASGAITGAVALVTDITDRKRVEEELTRLSYTNKLLLESAGDGIWGVDTRGAVTFINKAGASMLGFEQEELIGKPSHAAWHYKRPDGSPYPAETCPIYAAYKDGADHIGQEMFWRKDGSGLPVDFTSMPIFEQDKITGAVVTFRDITGRRQAEEERERLLAELSRSNKELEEFAYVASHDLQEPLRMVASYVQLLEKRYTGRLDEKADKFIFYAVDGARRMQKLIDGLLDYSRVSTRAREFSAVDINAVFNDAVRNLSAMIKESKAQLTKDGLPKVKGDETQLLQLFQNLIANAIKFRKPGITAEVHVDAKRAGKEWIFAVRDNGIGIEREFHDRIFVIFQRLHRTEEYPGTGIGLAVCKKIVERHGGRIWVVSNPGEGTTFFFTIPFRPGDA